ncbi:MAG TPA: tetratricopeptide repeat protein [Gemmatimonadaceae bacterium]|jgi:predicted negative regulator of RcsB-dependent stress response
MTKTGGAARPSITADPDSLLDTFQLYRKQLTIAAVVVAVVVGGAFVWRANSARRETQAEKAFFDAMNLVSQRDAKAPDALIKVAQRYGNTAGGIQAALLYAQSKFDEGRYADGQKVLDGISAPKAFAAGVESLKAAGYEGEQKFDLAAEHYLKAVDKAELQGEKDFLKGEAARALAASGKRAEAAKLWGELAARPDSPMASEAKIRVGELTATAAKP